MITKLIDNSVEPAKELTVDSMKLEDQIKAIEFKAMNIKAKADPQLFWDVAWSLQTLASIVRLTDIQKSRQED